MSLGGGLVSAFTDKVAVELGRSPSSLTVDELASVEQWASQARTLISTRFPTAVLDPEAVELVVLWAVVARMSAPKPGVSAIEVGVDDARLVERFGPTASGVWIRPEWWLLLTPSSDGGAFSVRPSFELDRPIDAW